MGKVTKDMGIIDIVQQYPESLEVFAKYYRFLISLIISFKIIPLSITGNS